MGIYSNEQEIQILEHRIENHEYSKSYQSRRYYCHEDRINMRIRNRIRYQANGLFLTSGIIYVFNLLNYRGPGYRIIVIVIVSCFPFEDNNSNRNSHWISSICPGHCPHDFSNYDNTMGVKGKQSFYMVVLSTRKPLSNCGSLNLNILKLNKTKEISSLVVPLTFSVLLLNSQTWLPTATLESIDVEHLYHARKCQGTRWFYHTWWVTLRGI